MVGVPSGTDEYAVERALGVVSNGGAVVVAWCVAWQKTCRIRKPLPSLSSITLDRRLVALGWSWTQVYPSKTHVGGSTIWRAHWAHEHIRPRGTGRSGAGTIVLGGGLCPGDLLTYRQAKARLSSCGGQKGLDCRRPNRGGCPLLALGSRVGWGIQPEVLTDLAGLLGG